MMDDSEDIRLVRRGDADAFSRLFDRHAKAVFRYALTILGNRQHAEDVLQETFLTLWARRKGLKMYGDSVLPWLLVTARNHSRNLGRLLMRRGTVPLMESDQAGTRDDPADLVTQRAALAAISGAVSRLSPTDQSLVTICVLGGMRYADAAARTGLTTAATARRVQRIRSRLREAGSYKENENG